MAEGFEEFDESEVIFPDQDKVGSLYFTGQEQGLVKPKKQRKKSSTTTGDRGWESTTGSLPVDIKPNNVLRLAGYHQDYCEYGGRELEPPHVIVGRRIAGNMAFSMCTGNGRKLKDSREPNCSHPDDLVAASSRTCKVCRMICGALGDAYTAHLLKHYEKEHQEQLQNSGVTRLNSRPPHENQASWITPREGIMKFILPG